MTKNCSELLESIRENITMTALMTSQLYPSLRPLIHYRRSSLYSMFPATWGLMKRERNNSRMIYEEGKSGERTEWYFISRSGSLFVDWFPGFARKACTNVREREKRVNVEVVLETLYLWEGETWKWFCFEGSQEEPFAFLATVVWTEGKTLGIEEGRAIGIVPFYITGRGNRLSRVY